MATPSFPANNVRELLEFAKKNPNKVSWSTTGIGSSWHLEVENINHRAGTDILHVPFPGFAQMLPPLFVHGLASGDFELALRGLLGEGAPLSAASSSARTPAGPSATRARRR